MKIGKFNIESDKDDVPGRFILYGAGSVGKTTLACTAPAPMVLCIEDGAREFSRSVPRIRFDGDGRVIPRDYMEVKGCLADIAAAPNVGDRKTLVIDGGSQLDVLVQERVVFESKGKWKSIAQAGFGAGEAEVLMLWRPLTQLLEEINRKHKMRIVITAHVQISKFKDPEGVEFGKYDIMATQHAKGDVPGFLYNWAEVVGFAKFETLTQEVGPEKRTRTVAVAEQGDRMLHLQWTNAWQAKCRLSGAPADVNLTDSEGNPLDWQQVFGQFEEKAPELMRAEIQALLMDVDEAQRKTGTAFLARVGDDVPALARSLERLRRGAVKKTNVEGTVTT